MLQDLETLEALITNVQDVIAVIGGDSRVVWESPSIERVLGYAPGELRGTVALEMIHPEDRPLAAEMLSETVAVPGATGALTSRFRHRDGTWRVLEATSKNLVHDPRIGGVVLNCRDVSDRARAAEQLEEARAAAERANRAKSEFLSRMSHELRTPMNAILGFAQILDDELEREEDRESVRQILCAGRHLLRLIDDVLEIARVEEGRLTLSPEPVSLAEVVEEAMEIVRPLAAERALTLRAHVPDDLHALADLQRLRQVLLNLLGNAIKYNRHGGSVHLGASRAGERVRLEVEDTGIGIAPDRLGSLFTPFERLGAELLGIEGNGLGLALSRRLVEEMHGELTARSTLGEGSAFRIELPLVSEHPRPATPPPPVRSHPGDPLRQCSGTVLLIEDNPGNRLLVERLLSRWSNVRLLTAADGRCGLQVATMDRPDLIILDLHLPERSGQEVLATLRASESLCAVPVLVVTADASAPCAPDLLALEPSAVLTKPLETDAFLRACAELLPGVKPQNPHPSSRAPGGFGGGTPRPIPQPPRGPSADPRYLVPPTSISGIFLAPLEPSDVPLKPSSENTAYERAVAAPGSAGTSGARG